MSRPSYMPADMPSRLSRSSSTSTQVSKAPSQPSSLPNKSSSSRVLGNATPPRSSVTAASSSSSTSSSQSQSPSQKSTRLHELKKMLATLTKRSPTDLELWSQIGVVYFKCGALAYEQHNLDVAFAFSYHALLLAYDLSPRFGAEPTKHNALSQAFINEAKSKTALIAKIESELAKKPAIGSTSVTYTITVEHQQQHQQLSQAAALAKYAPLLPSPSTSQSSAPVASENKARLFIIGIGSLEAMSAPDLVLILRHFNLDVPSILQPVPAPVSKSTLQPTNHGSISRTGHGSSSDSLPTGVIIDPATLYDLLFVKRCRILLLDIRPQAELELERISHKYIVSFDPLFVWPGKDLNELLVVSSPYQMSLAEQKQLFDAFVFLDTSSKASQALIEFDIWYKQHQRQNQQQNQQNHAVDDVACSRYLEALSPQPFLTVASALFKSVRTTNRSDIWRLPFVLDGGMNAWKVYAERMRIRKESITNSPLPTGTAVVTPPPTSENSPTISASSSVSLATTATFSNRSVKTVTIDPKPVFSRDTIPVRSSTVPYYNPGSDIAVKISRGMPRDQAKASFLKDFSNPYFGFTNIKSDEDAVYPDLGKQLSYPPVLDAPLPAESASKQLDTVLPPDSHEASVVVQQKLQPEHQQQQQLQLQLQLQSPPPVPPKPNADLPTPPTDKKYQTPLSPSQPHQPVSLHRPPPQAQSPPQIPPKPVKDAPEVPNKPALPHVEPRLTRSRSATDLKRAPKLSEIATIIPSKSAGESTIGLIGLHNYANTCYMNSIIQCLNATAPLRNLMRSGKYVKYLNTNNVMGSNGVIAVEFANLLNIMWKPDESFITPNAFRSAVRKHTKDRFAGDDQQDAQEFLTYLLNTLHEDLNTSEFCKSGVSQMDLTDEMTMKLEQKAVAVRSKYEFNRSLYRDKSKIADIFSGQQSSKLKCSVCGFTSTTYNLFDLLSVPIPDSSHKGAVPLQKCLEEYFKAETLSGNDAWECRKCKVKRTSTKKLILTRLPNVLTIHLKRFKGDGILNEKLRTFVDFPITGLDMSQFIHPGVAGTDENKVSKYNLFAVSNHYGNLDGGHYYSFVKAPLSEQWFVLEDRNVKTLATQDICIDQAYVLFYVRDQL